MLLLHDCCGNPRARRPLRTAGSHRIDGAGDRNRGEAVLGCEGAWPLLRRLCTRPGRPAPGDWVGGKAIAPPRPRRRLLLGDRSSARFGGRRRSSPPWDQHRLPARTTVSIRALARRLQARDARLWRIRGPLDRRPRALRSCWRRHLPPTALAWLPMSRERPHGPHCQRSPRRLLRAGSGSVASPGRAVAGVLLLGSSSALTLARDPSMASGAGWAGIGLVAKSVDEERDHALAVRDTFVGHGQAQTGDGV